jgi:hypothetical protein
MTLTSGSLSTCKLMCTNTRLVHDRDARHRHRVIARVFPLYPDWQRSGIVACGGTWAGI